MATLSEIIQGCRVCSRPWSKIHGSVLQWIYSSFGQSRPWISQIQRSISSVVRVSLVWPQNIFSLYDFSDVMFHWYFHFWVNSLICQCSENPPDDNPKYFSPRIHSCFIFDYLKNCRRIYNFENGYNFGIEMDFGPKRKSKKYHCRSWISRLSPRISHYHGQGNSGYVLVPF